MRDTLAFFVKAFSRLKRRVWSVVRVIWLNFTNFGYYRPLPMSTMIYGRVLTLESPTRLHMGPRGRIGDSVYFATGQKSEIVLGTEVFINLGCVLVASERIEIGERTSIAEYVSIRDQEHYVKKSVGTRDQGFRIKAVKIGRNVWIGRGAYIGPGSVIGDGCVIAANSVVSGGNFPPNVLIAGAPASIKKSIDS